MARWICWAADRWRTTQNDSHARGLRSSAKWPSFTPGDRFFLRSQTKHYLGLQSPVLQRSGVTGTADLYFHAIRCAEEAYENTTIESKFHESGGFLFTLRTLAFFALSAVYALPQGSRNTYNDLLRLFQEWREFQKPVLVNGFADYSPSAMAAQQKSLKKYQARLAALDMRGWPVSEVIDYNLVRAEMDGLEFDGRVLHPWFRDPSFYTSIIESESDVPLHEGPYAYGTLELWQHPLPLSPSDVTLVRTKLAAIPPMLAQAKKNLTESHKDLWTLAIHGKREESRALADFSRKLAATHPDLAAAADRARAAVDEFRGWLEVKVKGMNASPAIGTDNYNWYLKHVHFVPYSWRELLAIEQRELQRSLASLALERQHNRNLPELALPVSVEELRSRNNVAIDEFLTFMKEQKLFTVRDYMNQNRLRGVPAQLQPERTLDVFSQVEYRDSTPMKTHAIHWLEKQRLEHEPHASPIRSSRLLYNIWDGRSEGFATAWEEIVMNVGLYDKRPRTRELVYFLVALRCIRGIADLKMHSGEFTLDGAIQYVVSATPNGWFKPDSQTLWNDLQIYAHQPSYGTTYIAGKVAFDHLLADRWSQVGPPFRFQNFMDQFFASGIIPMSLIRWEMTGKDDEISQLGLRVK